MPLSSNFHIMRLAEVCLRPVNRSYHTWSRMTSDQDISIAGVITLRDNGGFGPFLSRSQHSLLTCGDRLSNACLSHTDSLWLHPILQKSPHPASCCRNPTPSLMHCHKFRAAQSCHGARAVGPETSSFIRSVFLFPNRCILLESFLSRFVHRSPLGLLASSILGLEIVEEVFLPTFLSLLYHIFFLCFSSHDDS